MHGISEIVGNFFWFLVPYLMHMHEINLHEKLTVHVTLGI